MANWNDLGAAECSGFGKLKLTLCTRSDIGAQWLVGIYQKALGM